MKKTLTSHTSHLHMLLTFLLSTLLVPLSSQAALTSHNPHHLLGPKTKSHHTPKKCIRNSEHTSHQDDIPNYPLFVFASFSLPEASLKSLSQELNIYGGAFVVRGLPENSFAKFAKKIQELREKGINAPFLIDPDAFKKYQISSVPTTILKTDTAYDKIIGNLTVSSSLEKFSHTGDTKELAKTLLQEARENSF